MNKSNYLKKISLNKLAIGIVSLILVCGLLFEFYKGYSISENKNSTVGTIIEFKSINKSRYGIKYEYFISGERYTGNVGVEYFECEKENGCVGSEIIVYYSSENPNLSQVNLKEYEKYKTTIDFN